MDTNFAVPALWIPFGTAQRIVGLTAVKTVTFPPGVQGIYVQALTQNVRVTIDGSTPSPTGNDLGFELRSTDPTWLFTGQPGFTLKFIQVTATAVIQYQLLTLGGRYA